MAEAVVVTLRSASRRGSLVLELPGRVPVRRLLPGLLAALQLTAGPDRYQLVHSNRCRILGAGEMLIESGVLTGDDLLLVSSAPASESLPEQSPQPHLTEALDVPGGSPGGRAIAFWSGPAGGTGRTTLALALSMLAAESGMDVLLLALNEPALSFRLELSREPNAMGFLAEGDLARVTQVVSWQGADGRADLAIVLGPVCPWGQAAQAVDVQALVWAAQAAHGLVVVDLPPLTPSPDAWVVGPLAGASEVVLVAPPTSTGVASCVAALAAVGDVAIDQEAGRSLRLVLNRCAPGGLAVEEFVAGVSRLWGTCPPLAASVGHVAGLAEQSGLPSDAGLFRALGSLLEPR